MTIRYCSDLHLEFSANKRFITSNPLTPGADVLILAGDIIPFIEVKKHRDFLDFVNDNFGVTYWLPGNHEYYHSDLADRTGAFRAQIRSNVILLNNSTEIVNKVKFVFSTLWSHVRPESQFIVQNSVNDFQAINFKGKPLTIEEFNRQNSDCVIFLQSELKNEYSGSTVVVTHHVPTKMNYPEIYKDSEIGEAFVSEQFDLIKSSGAKYWIYGHHHSNIPEFSIGETKVVTNQLGYVHRKEHLYFSWISKLEF